MTPDPGPDPGPDPDVGRRRLLGGLAALGLCLGAALAAGGAAALARRGIGGLRSFPQSLPESFAETFPESLKQSLPQGRSGAPVQDGPRILAFGTSLTAQYDWPEALAARLGGCLGRPVAMARVARGGRGSAWGLGQVGAVIAARPQLVLLEFTANDADLRLGTSPAESLRLHREILARLGAALPGLRVLLLGMNPVFGLRALARPRAGAYLENYAALAAADPLCGFLDLGPAWRARLAAAPGRRALIPDGLHPDPAAARAVIVPALAAALAPLWGERCREAG